MLSAIKSYIKDRFGSRSGLVNAVGYKVRYWFGLYREHQRIDFARVDKLVFVCSGNICRSPFAEVVARSLGVETESYGLHCRGNDPADPRAIEIAGRKGLDLNTHLTRNISQYSPGPGDLLVAMEPAQLQELGQLGFHPAQATLACLWKNAPTPYLHDPFGCGQTFFERCEADLELAVKRISNHVNPISR